ncbi:response regulator receiver domain protein [Clostridium sp. KLE 1755]|uniref:LytR/AlgR family response regulator transcription factor n=1 Tax=Clostridium sp. KLE 1755 TaxID=1226325 RepID=UPI0003966D9C|nr:LytTR family DNA-binding domain-containing protein [Clostridium sp. KLE 1755]ERI70574.1 response regulator receiver domain protein [Clostridium sp. KLE 1755]
MIKISIVDDDESFTILLKRKVTDYFEENKQLCQIDTFSNTQLFYYELTEKQHYDICFMDIEMPGINGIQLAEKLREYDKNTYLVFVTSYFEFAAHGYSLKAFDFIQKSLLDEKLSLVLTGIVLEMKRTENRFYCTETDVRLQRIEYKEIIYLYKSNKNTVIVSMEEEIQVRKPLQTVFQELNSEEFIWVERGYIINLEHIMGMNGRDIRLRNGTVIRAGKARARTIKEAIHDYWRNWM